jgi:rhodanese-related sulfurtransferase
MNWRSIQARTAMVVLAAALLGGCGAAAEKTATADGHDMATKVSAAPQSGEAFARLDPAAFADHMKDKDAALINVHVPYEGEIEGTGIFIPYDKILESANLPKEKDKEILLYCRTGRMSEEAGNALHNAGYTNLAHLEGGMRGWEASGRPLIQNPAHAVAESTPTPMPMPLPRS